MADTDVRAALALAFLSDGFEDLSSADKIERILKEIEDYGLAVVPAKDEAKTKADLQFMREDRDTWFEDALARRREMGEERARANEAEDKLHEVGMVRTWRNEDGKSFVFTADISAILHPGAALPATEETRDE